MLNKWAMLPLSPCTHLSDDTVVISREGFGQRPPSLNTLAYRATSQSPHIHFSRILFRQPKSNYINTGGNASYRKQFPESQHWTLQRVMNFQV